MEGNMRQVLEESCEWSGGILSKFCIGRGQYPTFQIISYKVCYKEKIEDDLPKSGKESGEEW